MMDSYEDRMRKGTKVQLRPGGLCTTTAERNPARPLGEVVGLPRPRAGEPLLATVEWDTGKTNDHDQRSLIVVQS